jgi:hemerythrin-like domain-containing protein
MYLKGHGLSRLSPIPIDMRTSAVSVCLRKARKYPSVQDLLRQTVDDIIRDFISHERQHMAMEERIVFPAVLNALRPEDWADIALQLADRYGSLSQPDFEEKFSTLRRNILEMEEEAEAKRPD